MKRLLGIGLFVLLCAIPVSAAEKNSIRFDLPWDLTVGSVVLPQGKCIVSWSEAKDGVVQLTLETKDKKTHTVPAKVGAQKPAYAGIISTVVGDVRHLKGFNSQEATYLVQPPPPESTK